MPKPNEIQTLGERLKKRREELGLTPEDVAEEIQTTPKYVRALEADQYDTFSAKVYALGFFKKLAATLALANPDSFVQEFSNEWEIRMFRHKRLPTPLPKNTGSFSLITPKRLGFGLGFIMLIVFIGFFSFRIVKFLGLPELSIETPKDQAIFFVPAVQIKGRAEKESNLTLNGREIRIDEAGFFDEGFEFAAGLNTLEFLAKNRFGKETKMVRYIFIK